MNEILTRKLKFYGFFGARREWGRMKNNLNQYAENADFLFMILYLTAWVNLVLFHFCESNSTKLSLDRRRDDSYRGVNYGLSRNQR